MSPINSNRVPSNRVPPDEESALPPSYTESQETEYRSRQVAKRKAQQILTELSGYQPHCKKSIVEHVINMLNNDPGQRSFQIYSGTSGASQVNSRETRPELNRWIKDKLSFYDVDEFGKLAFATGHWNTFKQSRDECPHNFKNQMEAFFQEYFVKEGTNQGIAKLTKIGDYQLFCATTNDDLKTALGALADDYSVEVIQPDGRSSHSRTFNYPVVAKHVASRLDRRGFFGARLGIDHKECNLIEDTYKKLRFQYFEMLHQFVEKSGPEDDLHALLSEALRGVGRNDIREKFEAELERENLI